MKRAIRSLNKHRSAQLEGVAHAFLAEIALWHGEEKTALTECNRARDLATYHKYEVDFIRVGRLQGIAALRSSNGDFTIASAHLNDALTRVRSCQAVDEELATLIALAELHWRIGGADHLDEARRFLDDVWRRADDGPYPLFHADALNILASIERAEGNLDKAREAGTEAYKKAWLQGPPFAYEYGLRNGEHHLNDLGVPLPQLPPYDDSLYEPMPDVEIIPAPPESD